MQSQGTRKLTLLGVKLATGLGLENESITIEALQDLVRTTPIFSKLLNKFIR